MSDDIALTEDEMWGWPTWHRHNALYTAPGAPSIGFISIDPDTNEARVRIFDETQV